MLSHTSRGREATVGRRYPAHAKRDIALEDTVEVLHLQKNKIFQPISAADSLQNCRSGRFKSAAPVGRPMPV